MSDVLTLQPFTDFAGVFDIAHYRPIPDNWLVAVSDVVDSTAAISKGAYKDVNLAGAATIVGVLNACGRDDLPFAFGGDGGLVFVAPDFESQCRAALAGVQRMCANVLNLKLRCSLIPVSELRNRGCHALVAAHDLGSGRILSMLAGGAVAQAEMLCKSPEGTGFAIAESETECDLTGLSCRWQPLKPERGAIMAMVVQALDANSLLPDSYKGIYARIAAMAGENASPAKRNALSFKWPARSVAIEAALGGREGQWKRRIGILVQSVVMFASMVTGSTVGGFNARRYFESLPRHSDYRKYADSLRMVIDCSPQQAAEIRAMLEAEWKQGRIEYGTHVASTALMTCFVRDLDDAGHVHFIDGADGGYGLAALDMKRRMAQASNQ